MGTSQDEDAQTLPAETTLPLPALPQAAAAPGHALPPTAPPAPAPVVPSQAVAAFTGPDQAVTPHGRAPGGESQPSRAPRDLGPLPVRERITKLTGDPRMPGWVRRTVIAAATGAPVAIVANWEAGAGVAGAAVTVDALFSHRVSRVIPAHVRVTTAQRRSRRRLMRLMMSGYQAVHARRIPGSNSVLDHLIVGPGGVFAVDSQYWDRRLPVRTTQGGRLFHGPFDQSGRLDHARWEAEQVSILVGQALGLRIAVRPAMVIYGPAVPWGVASIRGVDVFGGRSLCKYLRRGARRDSPWGLDEKQTAVLQAVAAQLFPPARGRGHAAR